MQAIIMAGGEGSRLRPLTCDIPKPMTRLCGRPVLEYILDLLNEHGVRDAAVTMQYLPQVITANLEEHYKGVRLRFVEEETPLGTLGTPEDVAQAVSFLVSDRARFITGQVLGVSGGFLI